MRKWLRLGLCLGLLTVALTCSALAATDGYTTDKDGTVDYANGKYTTSYAGVTSGEEYALLVVAGTPEKYTVNEESIMYIDQKAADGEEITFDFIPRSTPDCVVLLGGSFNGTQSPKVLGTLEGQGVSVSGSVTLQGRKDHSGATVTLKGAETYTTTTDEKGAFTLDGVAAGDYTLTITMPGYLTYTKTTLTVEDTTTVPAKELLGGDVDSAFDGYVNASDIQVVLGNFTKEPPYEGVDINDDGYINATEISIILSNFGKTVVTEE